MKTTLAKIATFPIAAVALGFATVFLFPEGFPLSEQPKASAEFARVTWKEVAPRVKSGEWLLVDARDEENFTAQHIPGAQSLPANSYPEMLEFFAEDNGKTRTVVVYCGTEDCDLSTELAARLRDEAGCTDVRILDGGFLAWQRKQ